MIVNISCSHGFSFAFKTKTSLHSYSRTKLLDSNIKITKSIPACFMKSNNIENNIQKENTFNLNKKLSIVSIAVTSSLFAFTTASYAGNDRGAGTITDKKYELCVSKCVFSETRPPPNGADNERILTTISRTDIIKDCRKSCAKTKEQLLLGPAKIKKTPQTSASN